MMASLRPLPIFLKQRSAMKSSNILRSIYFATNAQCIRINAGLVHNEANNRNILTGAQLLGNRFCRKYSNNDSQLRGLQILSGGFDTHNISLTRSSRPARNLSSSSITTSQSYSSTGSTSKSDDSNVDNSSSSSSSSSSSGDETNASYDSVNHIKLVVLDAAVQFIPEYGWSEQSIAKGAESLGYSSMAHGIVEGGGAELFSHLQMRLNEQLEQHLKQLEQDGQKHPHSRLSKEILIEEGLKYRLSLVVPYLSLWTAGLVQASLSPEHVTRGIANVAAMADHIAHYSGDTSVDSSWYTERISIGVIYKMTELCMLQDKSENYQDTWSFLRRRVSTMHGCSDVLSNLDTIAADTVKLGSAAVATGFNVLGMNGKFQ